MRHRLMFFCMGIFAVSASAFAQWTDITPSHMLEDLNFSARSAAWGDYDNDGFVDLYIGIRGAPNYLYRNIGDGQFVDVTTPALAIDGLTHHVLWGDFNNNGLLDLYVGQVNNNTLTDRCVLLENLGDGVFVDVTNGEPLQLHTRNPRGGSWVDVNRDGLLDLYMGITPGASRDNRIMINQGDGLFADAFNPVLAQGETFTYAVAWGDFNNNGLQDVYVSNGWDQAPSEDFVRTRSTLLMNMGDGTFVDVGEEAGVVDMGLGRGVAWGDYTNNGFLDLFVGNMFAAGVDGRNRLYRNNGDGTFTEVSAAAGITENQRTRSVAWVDFDNDGWLDLHVVNGGNNNAEDRLYRNNGDGTFTEVGAGTPIANPGNGNAAAWADINNNGRMDVFVGLIPSRFSVLVRNDFDNSNNWLKVHLTGVASNRAAIGARVRVEAGGLSQIREVQSGSGYMAQHMLTAHFGLGDASAYDSITILWPSGRTQTLAGGAANQLLQITEPLVNPYLPLHCIGDINRDNVVNGADLGLLLAAWGGCTGRCEADLNGDGVVNGADLGLLLAAWGACPP